MSAHHDSVSMSAPLSPRSSKSWMLSLILVIVSIILIGVSLVVPWYSLTVEQDYQGSSTKQTITTDYYLQGWEMEAKVTAGEQGSETERNDADWEDAETETADVFKVQEILVIASFALTIVAFVMIFLSGFSTKIVNLALILMLVSFALSLSPRARQRRA